jgi:hypothetical protein
MRIRFALIGLLACAACSSPNNSGFGDSGLPVDPFVDPNPDGGTFTKNDATVVPSLPSEVFGHSDAVLYRLDPITKAVTAVGDFKNCKSPVFDIALNESGQMYGTTATGLFSIDKKTAACTQIGTGMYPNSLSFVPKGTLDAAEEALVGFEDADYVRINTTTGAKTVVKAGALKEGLISSGDVVSVKGGPTYLTVKATATSGKCSAEDCLVELNPSDGSIKTNLGSLNGFQDVFGLAFWAGAVYGFTKTGDLFEITIGGGTLKTKKIAVPGAPATLKFYGAGSATSAPVGPA